MPVHSRFNHLSERVGAAGPHRPTDSFYFADKIVGVSVKCGGALRRGAEFLQEVERGLITTSRAISFARRSMCGRCRRAVLRGFASGCRLAR